MTIIGNFDKTGFGRDDAIIRLSRTIGLGASFVFGFVGIVFLLLPAEVIGFFNNLSPLLGMPTAPIHASGIFHVLAVGYMYVVTLLAFLMYRYPTDGIVALLLINAKATSALLSILSFAFARPYLVLLVNAIVDGTIAIGFFYLHLMVKRIAP